MSTTKILIAYPERKFVDGDTMLQMLANAVTLGLQHENQATSDPLTAALALEELGVIKIARR